MTFEQARQPLQGRKRRAEAFRTRPAAQQPHRYAQVARAAGQLQRVLDHRRPVRWLGRDPGVAVLLLGLARGGTLERQELGVVGEVFAAGSSVRQLGQQ
jgi:hypothetical protein